MRSAHTEFSVNAAYAHHVTNLALPESFKLIEQREVVVFTFKFEAEDDCQRESMVRKFNAWLADTVLNRIVAAHAAK